MLNTHIFETLPHVQSGKLRSIGITSARRVAAIPNIPTIAESGLPGYESVQWSALLAPAKMPRAITERLHKEVAAILRAPALRKRLEKNGNEGELLIAARDAHVCLGR